jgi:sulfate adenylyltransferase
MSETIAAHGGSLINRWASSEKKQELLENAEKLRRIQLNIRQISDLELIADGAGSPLSGFLTEKNYQSVVNTMRLENGLPWSIPVTLSISAELAKLLEHYSQASLVDECGNSLAILDIEDIYDYDKEKEAQKVYGTLDPAHPGVAALYRQDEYLIGGSVTVLQLPRHDEFPSYYLTPSETRQLFIQKGWKTVTGFQTRNPVHRAHEYLQKCALEMTDGLLLHPLVGETKSDDIPADVRMRCYEVLLENYYPKERVLLAVNPASMRYAGPREAIFHALIRKNYGCTHFIIGRDHAGVGNYYGTYDAQVIFDRFTSEEIGIIPLKFEHSFWCRKCGSMASSKTCPHNSAEHIALSGTRVRELLSRGEEPPVEFTRPEVAKILIAVMQESKETPVGDGASSR